MLQLPAVKLLDHGYLQVVEWWGSDERVVETARMSTSGAFKGWGPTRCPECGGDGQCPLPEEGVIAGCGKCQGTGKIPGDEKLLRYLYEHHHDSPFEFAGMIVEVQAPILVFREWHR